MATAAMYSSFEFGHMYASRHRIEKGLRDNILRAKETERMRSERGRPRETEREIEGIRARNKNQNEHNFMHREKTELI